MQVLVPTQVTMDSTKRDMFDFLITNKELINWKDISSFKDATFRQMRDIIIHAKPGNKIIMPSEFYKDFNEYPYSFIMEKEVAFYGAGKAFGELAIMKNAPRAATIRSFSSTVELAVLSSGSYKSVLGQI